MGDILGGCELNMEVVFRLCRPEDVPALEWEGRFEAHRQVFRDAFEAQERGEAALVLAVANGVPIGQVFLDLVRAEAGTVWAFRVRPPFRGLGVGRRLLRAAETLLWRAGLHVAELTVEKDNPAALRFYERCGYDIVDERIERWSTVTPDGRRIDHELDTWLMRKALPRVDDTIVREQHAGP